MLYVDNSVTVCLLESWAVNPAQAPPGLSLFWDKARNELSYKLDELRHILARLLPTQTRLASNMEGTYHSL